MTIDAASTLNHVMVRGIEKTAIFRNDADRNHFLERPGKILERDGSFLLCMGADPFFITHQELLRSFHYLRNEGVLLSPSIPDFNWLEDG